MASDELGFNSRNQCQQSTVGWPFSSVNLKPGCSYIDLHYDFQFGDYDRRRELCILDSSVLRLHPADLGLRRATSGANGTSLQSPPLKPQDHAGMKRWKRTPRDVLEEDGEAEPGYEACSYCSI